LKTTGVQAKRVLVIGGGPGIGRAIAEAVIREGATVVLASTNAGKIARVAEQLGTAAAATTLNVTDEPAVARFFADAGRFDHIAFTAGDWGGFGPSSLADLNLSEAPKGLNVRFWGALAVAKHGASALPPGGSFTLTGGMLAHRPSKGWPLATAVAAAVEFLSHGLAVDLAPVRVNCVCPGLIRTEMWDDFPEQRREALVKMTEHQLLPRPGRPSEAAEAYLYLMRNDFVTGQTLYVEGGIALSH
jgi:NAD(P)-dependent dehydrogenase (short-subunit alcohol dehydrogenase family)